MSSNLEGIEPPPTSLHPHPFTKVNQEIYDLGFQDGFQVGWKRCLDFLNEKGEHHRRSLNQSARGSQTETKRDSLVEPPAEKAPLSDGTEPIASKLKKARIIDTTGFGESRTELTIGIALVSLNSPISLPYLQCQSLQYQHLD